MAAPLPSRQDLARKAAHLALEGAVQAPTPAKRVAWITFLFQFQHYNADYTPDTLESLGYPRPLMGRIQKSGYWRTDPEQQVAAALSFFRQVNPKIGRKTVDKLLVLHSRALDMLKSISEGSCQFFDLETDDPQNSEDSIATATLTLEELDGAIDNLIQRQSPEKYKKNLEDLVKKASKDRFVILFFTYPGHDLAVLAGCKVRRTKKGDVQSEFCALTEMLSKNTLSTIRMAGGSVDRFVYNDVFAKIIRTLGNPKQALSNLISSQDVSDIDISSLPKWSSPTREINLVDSEHQGIALYREGLLFWEEWMQGHSCYAEIESLLISYVSPWIRNPKLSDWAKGYQNLCEIVLMLLKIDPTFWRKPTDLVRALPLELARHSPKMKLFPYAMAAYLSAIKSSIDEIKPSLDKAVTIASLDQNYFEILSVLESQFPKDKGDVEVSYYTGLHKIQDIPDILIADIHPNNAARSILFQNDLANWIKNLDAGRSLTLIIDLTMNHFEDKKCRILFDSMHKHIVEGRLKVHIIQSLAKLIQLGADNMSGGLTLSINTSIKEELCHPPAPEKLSYVAHLLGPGKHLVSSYIEIVRRNTNYVYSKLRDTLKAIRGLGYHSPSNRKKIRVTFCPVNLTTNGDDQTAYVALNFAPLYSALDLKKDNAEKLTKVLYEALQKLVLSRKHPITFRQSFGFSLSNVTMARQALRFSIGVESNEELDQHVELIDEWIRVITYVASRYTVNTSGGETQLGLVKDFERIINQVVGRIVDFNNKKINSITLPVEEETFGDFGCQDWDEVGEAVIEYHEGFVKVAQNGEELKLKSLAPDSDRSEWIHFTVLQDEYHIRKIVETKDGNLEVVYILCPRNDLDGHRLAFSFSEGKAPAYTDQETGAEFTLMPSFSLTYQGVEYSDKEVFTRDGAKLNLGDAEVGLDKLDEKREKEWYNLLVKHKLSISCSDQPKKISLRFGDEYPKEDYWGEFRDSFKQEGWAGLQEYLSNCLLRHKDGSLPPSTIWNFRSDRTQDAIIKELASYCKKVGKAFIVENLPAPDLQDNLFPSPDFNNAFFEGVSRAFLKKLLDPEHSIPSPSLPIVERALKETLSNSPGFKSDMWMWLENHLNDFLSKCSDGNLQHFMEIVFPQLENRFLSGFLFQPEYGACEFTGRYEKNALTWQKTAPKLLDSFSNCKEKNIQGFESRKTWDPEKLSHLFGCFVVFEWDDAQTERILKCVNSISPEVKKSWLISPKFYHMMFTQDVWELREIGDPDDIVITSRHQEKVRKFFGQMEGHKLLIDLGEEEGYAVLRWACIINEPELWVTVWKWLDEHIDQNLDLNLDTFKSSIDETQCANFRNFSERLAAQSIYTT